MSTNIGYVALSRQMAIRDAMDAVAQNIANVDTPGFKNERMLFSEYLFRAPGQAPISYVQKVGVRLDFAQGPLYETGDPLDVGIEGDGFFVIRTPQGPRYTRRGHFVVDAERRLVTSDGHPVLGTDEREITLGAGDHQVSIASDGTVSAESGRLGRLKLVAFGDKGRLAKAGPGLYATDQTPQKAKDAKLRQGMLERSNVQPIMEMTRMINLLRSYQSAERLASRDHELKRRMIEEMTTTA